MCNSAFSTIDSGNHLTCLCKSLSLMLPPCFTRHAMLQGVTCRPPVMRWVSLGSNTTDQFDFWRKADLKPRSWIHVTTDPRKRLNLQTGIFSLVIFEIRQPPSIRWGCYLMIQYPTVFHSQWGRTANWLFHVHLFHDFIIVITIIIIIIHAAVDIIFNRRESNAWESFNW